MTAVQVREAANCLDLSVIEPELDLLLAPGGDKKGPGQIGELACEYLNRGQEVIITTSSTPHLEERSGDIAVALGRLALSIMERSPVGGLFLTGGDIALQVCLALDARALQPVREASPGLPLSLLDGGAWAGTPIVTKAGGFGEPDSIVVGIRSLKNWSDHE
jgi:uncharacterized protein YgbK (DUF1537 family)